MINLENYNNSELNDLLTRFFIDSTIDEDGDLFIENPSRLYINFEKEHNVLRLFSFIHNIKNGELSSEKSEQIKDFTEKKNKSSYSVKYSILTERGTTIMCEYGIPLNGSVDDKFIIKLIRHVESEIVTTRELLSIIIKD